MKKLSLYIAVIAITFLGGGYIHHANAVYTNIQYGLIDTDPGKFIMSVGETGGCTYTTYDTAYPATTNQLLNGSCTWTEFTNGLNSADDYFTEATNGSHWIYIKDTSTGNEYYATFFSTVGVWSSVLSTDTSSHFLLPYISPENGTTTATTSGNSITISSIDQTYKALKVVGQDINRAGTADIRIYPRNGSTDLACKGTLNYHTNTTEIYPYDAIYGTANNGQITNAYPMYFVWDIFDYASTTREKNFELNGAFSRQGLSPERYVGWNVYGVIDSTSAINALNFYSDQAFNAGQILVYGVN